MNESVVSTAANVTNVNFLNTIIGFFEQGGVFMGVILLVWGIGIAICLERFSKLKRWT